MITGSINKPDPFALSLSTRTTTLLACPARAMLLVIIATMVWGKPAPRPPVAAGKGAVA